MINKVAVRKKCQVTAISITNGIYKQKSALLWKPPQEVRGHQSEAMRKKHDGYQLISLQPLCKGKNIHMVKRTVTETQPLQRQETKRSLRILKTSGESTRKQGLLETLEIRRFLVSIHLSQDCGYLQLSLRHL